ncbi:MAG: alpha/beta hydrolase [Pseudomonadota bacterium]
MCFIKAIQLFLLTGFVISCHSIQSPFIAGVVGEAGEHTPIVLDTQGNPQGYYEYLPKGFEEATQYPLLFYWNGANAISGNGSTDLPGLLTQGLPQWIHQGKDYPLIVISAQLKNWKKDDIHPFVTYILKKYASHINPRRIYMTGFSAGGGITVRYVYRHPHTIAAIVPVAAALHPLKKNQELNAMAEIPSWFFHNRGDQTVSIQPAIQWHEALKKMGGDHQMTVFPVDGHYAWQAAYSNDATWRWLLNQEKSE